MELVDVLDSKSCEVQPSCRFDPGHRHHKKTYLIGLFILFVSIKKKRNEFRFSFQCLCILSSGLVITDGAIILGNWHYSCV